MCKDPECICFDEDNAVMRQDYFNLEQEHDTLRTRNAALESEVARHEKVYQVVCQDRTQIAEQLDNLESKLTKAEAEVARLRKAMEDLRKYLMGFDWKNFRSPDEFIKQTLEASDG